MFVGRSPRGGTVESRRSRSDAPRGQAPARWTACRPDLMAGPLSIGRNFPLLRTAYVSTYPPRRGGVASFTSDLSSCAGHREVVALHVPDLAAGPYPAEVHHVIR